MADDSHQDEQSKTEDPTEKRLEDAFDEGQVALSKEILHWVTLMGAMTLIFWIFPVSLKRMFTQFQQVFRLCGDEVFSNTSSPVYSTLFFSYLEQSAFLVLILILLLIAGFSQTRFNITLSNLMPKGERLSPLKGLTRIFGTQGWIEFLKNIIKIILVATVMLWALWGIEREIPLMPFLNLFEGCAMIMSLVKRVFFPVIIFLGGLALLDYLYQRFSWWKKLKMSRHDVKQEIKEQEGSPEIKQKFRQIRGERLKSQTQAKVKLSTVVITNPTHYAVAILWDETLMDTPRVVAKGVDFMAQHIKKIAKENNIPIVENQALARSLYDKVSIDHDILTEHYRAVAEVIKYIMELQRKWF